jgi:uncharacterized protein (DUF2267 family)
MSTTGLPAFDATVQKTNEILHAIEDVYGWPVEERHRAYEALRAVLHTLRDRLTVQEAADLAAQLPMLVRGFYYEGWVPSRVPIKMDRDDFLGRVRHELPFELEGSTEDLVVATLLAVERFVSDGEWRDIAAIVPADVRELLPV